MMVSFKTLLNNDTQIVVFISCALICHAFHFVMIVFVIKGYPAAEKFEDILNWKIYDGHDQMSLTKACLWEGKQIRSS